MNTQIAKGKWKETGSFEELWVDVPNKTKTTTIYRGICNVKCYDSNNPDYEEAKAHAELIVLAGNLAQKYNIEAFEGLLRASCLILDSFNLDDLSNFTQEQKYALQQLFEGTKQATE